MIQEDQWDAIQRQWEKLLNEEWDLAAATYLFRLAALAYDAETETLLIESQGVTWSQETLLGAVIRARYAEARLAVRNGFDPRCCALCGGTHLDLDCGRDARLDP